MSKQARREQLLDTALAMVRAQGADALTLPTLAEAAGVSRPIVYSHFDTRPALLLALYRRLYERHRAATAEALDTAGSDATQIAWVMSAAYFGCAADMPEFTAISAALKGDPAMDAAQLEMLDSYTDLMADALRPHSGRTGRDLRLRCVGLLGAAEALAAELNRGRITVAAAITALADLIVGSPGAGSSD
ncbi:TetR/AcrR family transcriptional regulator [Nocardia sp. 2]|uniref:TetR/AcrR family transcriptional regulator n=1 Tax=Nocardia acididurans TaxID=2802282 RepID=A0ABS1M0Y6_9NOCA|nr:TetR/AcrR family transcriptional regulator [Nocardia acididurans]